jgi:AcrR family transcriptional regulator
MSGGTRNPLQRPPEERRAALSRHLLEVLEPVLASETPYADLSVARILALGGISRKAFYAYFADKGDLLQAMAAHVIQEIHAAGSAWWELADDADAEAVREALRPAVLAYLRHRTVMRAVAEASAYDARVRATYATLMDGAIDELATHLARQQAAGRARPTSDPRRTATWLIWMLERGLYQAVSAPPQVDADPWLEALAEITWRTLYEGHR